MRAIQVYVLVLAFWCGQSMAGVTCASLSDTLDPAIKSAAKSVVTVGISYVLNDSGAIETYGSGFVVGTQGHVITSAHLFDGFRRVLHRPGMRYAVTLFNCRAYEAELVSATEYAGFVPDATLLKIVSPPHDLAVARIGTARSLKKGDRVFAIGSPHHVNNAVIPGEILETSAVRDDLSIVPFIHANTPIDLGASGGALFDASGNVVGLTTACMGADVGVAGFACVRDGFFVPIDLVMKFAQPYIAAP